jgi:hypothetical protein
MPCQTKYNFSALKTRCREIVERELGQPDSHTETYSSYKCPFHNERTPSFRVWDDHWTCFGACGTTGDTVDFLQRLHHMTIKQVFEAEGVESNDSSQAEYKLQRELERQARAAEVQAKREAFTHTNIWERYHANLTTESRAIWTSAGIEPYYQDMWKFGFTPDKPYEYQDTLLHSPALTIPYSTFINGQPPSYYTVQYRLLEPANPSDKYRFEKDLGSGLWVARPDLHPGEKLTRVLLAEGAKKAAVSYIRLRGAMQVLGAPSKNGLSAWIDVLAQFDEVYIWMDPDITEKPKSAKSDWRPGDELLCQALTQARYVRYPKYKLDDAILKFGMTKDQLLDIMKYSSRR